MIVVALITRYYDNVQLKKQIAETAPKSIEGYINEIDKRASYVVFKIDGESFRSQKQTGPCLDIIDEVKPGRKVKLDYVFIEEWPKSGASGNCVLNAVFR